MKRNYAQLSDELKIRRSTIVGSLDRFQWGSQENIFGRKSDASSTGDIQIQSILMEVRCNWLAHSILK